MFSKYDVNNAKHWLNRLKNTKEKYGNKQGCVITEIDEHYAYDEDLDLFINALEYVANLKA